MNIVIGKNGKEYDLDSGFKLYSNGAIFDTANHKIVTHVADHALIEKPAYITSETQPDFAVMRKQRELEGAQAGLIGLARISKNKSSQEAWANIVEAQARVAINSEKFGTKASEFVGKATGYLPDYKHMDRGRDIERGLTMSVDKDTLIEILSIIREVKRDVDIIDGT